MSQKEDVYETEDVESMETVDYEETFEDPAIEKIHVDIEGSIKLFGSRILNADNVDFTDTLRKRRGYRSGQYILELVEPEAEETVEEKFKRLRLEVEELTAQVEREKTEGVTNDKTISKSALDELSDLLNAAIRSKESTEVRSILPAGIPKAALKTANAKSLDERIKRIEQAVHGDQSGNVRVHHAPLIETMENLRVQVDILNPAYLDGVSSSLNSALAKLTELDENQSKHQEDDQEQKVNKLYQLVTEWDVTCTNVPSIVKRLHSLSKLHEQAQEFAAKLNDVNGLKRHVEKKVENYNTLLFELKRESTKFVSDVSAKITELEKRS